MTALCRPYGTVRNIDSDGTLSPNLYVLVTVLYAVASCANPFLYGAMNANIRAIVRHTLHVDHVLKALGFAVRDANGRTAADRRNGGGTGTVDGNGTAIEPPRNPPGTPVMTLTSSITPTSPSPVPIHRPGARTRSGNNSGNNIVSIVAARRFSSLAATASAPPQRRKMSGTAPRPPVLNGQTEVAASGPGDATECGGSGDATQVPQQRRASALLAFAQAPANRSRCCASPVVRRMSRDLSACALSAVPVSNSKPLPLPISEQQGSSRGSPAEQTATGSETSCSGPAPNSRPTVADVICSQSPSRKNLYARRATLNIAGRLT